MKNSILIIILAAAGLFNTACDQKEKIVYRDRVVYEDKFKRDRPAPDKKLNLEGLSEPEKEFLKEPMVYLWDLEKELDIEIQASRGLLQSYQNFSLACFNFFEAHKKEIKQKNKQIKTVNVKGVYIEGSSLRPRNIGYLDLDCLTPQDELKTYFLETAQKQIELQIRQAEKNIERISQIKAQIESESNLEIHIVYDEEDFVDLEFANKVHGFLVQLQVLLKERTHDPSVVGPIVGFTITNNWKKYDDSDGADYSVDINSTEAELIYKLAEAGFVKK